MDLKAKAKSASLWLNSALILVLFFAHVIIQHKLVALDIAPVRTDPRDGVNSFAFITIAFIAVGSLLRIFRADHLLPARRSVRNSTQEGASLAILITLLAETVALARHPAMWIRIGSPLPLFALIGALILSASAMQLLVIAQ